MMRSRPVKCMARAALSARSSGSAVKSAMDASLTVTASDSGRRRRPLQTRAEGRGHVLHHVLAVALGFGVFEVAAEVVEDAVEAGAAGFGAGRAVEEEVLLLGGEVGEGLLEVDLVLFGGKLDEAQQVGGAGAGAHGSVEQRLGPVGDGLGGVEVVDAAEAVALGAGAVVGVEGEAARFEPGDVDAAVGAGHGRGVEGFVHAVDGDEDEALGHLQGFGDGGFEAAGVVFGGGIGEGCGGVVGWQRLEDDAVDDGFDGVVLALFEAHALGEFDHLAVDAGAEALLVERFQLFAELALAPAHDGGIDGDALAGGERGDALDDLLGGLAGDGAVAVGAVGLADARVEQAKIVVDLGDGADGGAGAAAGGLLLDGDGGREAVDGVHIGPLHLVEELAGVGGEGFDVAALALGIDGVEGERRFARAGEAGDDGERVARDADVDVAQVVLARSADCNVRDTHE